MPRNRVVVDLSAMAKKLKVPLRKLRAEMLLGGKGGRARDRAYLLKSAKEHLAVGCGVNGLQDLYHCAAQFVRHEPVRQESLPRFLKRKG